MGELCGELYLDKTVVKNIYKKIYKKVKHTPTISHSTPKYLLERIDHRLWELKGTLEFILGKKKLLPGARTLLAWI